MNEKRIKKFSQLSLDDLLTVDAYDRRIKILDEDEKDSRLLITRKDFFDSEGLYVEPETSGLKEIKPKRKRKKNRHNTQEHDKFMSIDKLIARVDGTSLSNVVLIEGFAGCGKSTLIQAILIRKLGYDCDYSLYNYNIQAQNAINIENGQKSSLLKSIRACFVNKFCTIANNVSVLNDFNTLLKKCRDYSQFEPLYTNLFNTDTYEDAIANIKAGKIESAERELNEQLGTIAESNSILALDYLLRLSLQKNNLINSLYICYDNLDAIEDADDLRDFDSRLIRFIELIDSFIDDNVSFLGKRPHFVIFATYRKFSAVLAELDKVAFHEMFRDTQNAIPNPRVIRIDATSAFSYRKIVAKRKTYFFDHFNAKEKALLDTQMSRLENWDSLNEHLKIMENRYSALWNRNYRSCSFIANLLFWDEDYEFSSCVSFITNPVKKHEALFDGFYEELSADEKSFEKAEVSESVGCTYFGGSSILLNSVCKVFNDYEIWDNLKLVRLHPNEPGDDGFVPSYDDVSLSRLILTYINNEEVVSLKSLYNTFCRHGLFSIDHLCDCLSKMLARDGNGVWRRPIFYSNMCFLPSDASIIRNELLDGCYRLKSGTDNSKNYMFEICESGRAYVERLMSEYEFFSNRLSPENNSIYMYEELRDLQNIMNKVFNSVHNCCVNMLRFKEEYMKRHGVTTDQYLQLKIHPRTNWGSAQLHTERIIFSHIAYLNKARTYFTTVAANSKTKYDYNKLFVEFIARYLGLYKNKLLAVSSVRERVFTILNEKTSAVLNEMKKDSPDEKILLQSISLH